jgi:hypothetical protein
MKKHCAVLLLTLMPLGIFLKDIRGQSPFLRGNVKWATGYPAIAVEVRLVQNQKKIQSVYTDQAGSYAFFGVEGRPSEYTVVVYRQKSILGESKVPEVTASRQIRDIVLTDQTLMAKVVALPETVVAGQRAVIRVTVLDRYGNPVPSVSITVSAGGGKFLKPGETFDPRSRLHSPYEAIGTTNAIGAYVTSWVCNPCARGYGLVVEANKDYYMPTGLNLTINVK